MSFEEKINPKALPRHVAIIMDGNGRWAKGFGKLRIFGHQHGVTAVREALEGCVKIGIPYLTLYAFSSENWSRPRMEINALMELLVDTLTKETKTFLENDIRLHVIGNISDLPRNCQAKLEETMVLTKKNTRCVLTLALSYGSRKEIIDATKAIIQRISAGELKTEDINEKTFSRYLYTADIPDPDLMIRTSGEQRISNFLLYQLAYTELCFLEKMWPEFTREDLFEAIYNYQQRERRFGKTSEQL